MDIITTISQWVIDHWVIPAIAAAGSPFLIFKKAKAFGKKLVVGTRSYAVKCVTYLPAWRNRRFAKRVLAVVEDSTVAHKLTSVEDSIGVHDTVPPARAIILLAQCIRLLMRENLTNMDRARLRISLEKLTTTRPQENHTRTHTLRGPWTFDHRGLFDHLEKMKMRNQGHGFAFSRNAKDGTKIVVLVENLHNPWSHIKVMTMNSGHPEQYTGCDDALLRLEAFVVKHGGWAESQ